MIKQCLKIFIFVALCNVAMCQLTYSDVASKVFFQIQTASGQKFILTSNMTAVRQLCPANVSLSWIIHGWTEGVNTEWVGPVASSTLKLFGGCVVIMDYSFFSKQAYGVIVDRYFILRDILADTVKRFGNYASMHFFGFSFGARLCIGLGNNLTVLNNGVPVIPSMHLCEPAGPEFAFGTFRFIAAQRAAKNVQCINTSDNLGTNVYDCHQNFKMGHCGRWQDGQGPFPKGSHGLCPYMYLQSFTNDFKHNPLFRGDCIYYFGQKDRPVNTTCQQEMLMGPRNKRLCNGDILVVTAKCEPYVYNGNINNFPAGKSTCV